MRKVLSILLLIMVLAFTTAASNYVPKVLSIHYDFVQSAYIGDEFSFKSNKLYTYKSTDEAILTYNEDMGIVETVAPGLAIIQKVNRETGNVVKTYAFLVKSEPGEISIIGPNSMLVGYEYNYSAKVYSKYDNDEVIWASSDTNVIEVDNNGKASAIGIGLATITATSKNYPDVYGYIYVMVNNSSEVEVKNESYTLNENSLSEAFEAIGRSVESSVLMVTGYSVNDGNLKEEKVGCGIIYKRVAHLIDGSTSEEDDIEYDKVVNYDYYVVTNKHIVANTTYNKVLEKSSTTNYDYIGLYYGGDHEIGAKIISYDEKIDLAVITFTTSLYFPKAKLGTSEGLKAGEFIVSVGTAEGKDYFRTISFGIISHPQRYISDDTDGDETNDWDAEYIQHDAPINSADCGSPIVNMKGEVIGINTTKKIETTTGIKAENLSFAIPIDLVKTLITSLEKGEVIKRPILGVTIMDVKAMLSDSEYYKLVLIEQFKIQASELPSWLDNDEIDHGFFVMEVTEGGVGSLAGIQIYDVIVKFNDVDVFYSYQLRGQLSNFIIGSGQTTTIVVYRNGEYVTLEVTF